MPPIAASFNPVVTLSQSILCASSQLAKTGDDHSPELLLVLGGIGLYFASRFGTHSLIGPKGLGSASGGTVALGNWMPIAAVAATALIAGRPELAVAVTFATSVAALSLGAGMIALFVPNESTPPERRAWPFVLPAALMVFLAGLGGGLNPIHALMLAGLGVAVAAVWQGQRTTEPEPAPSNVGTPQPKSSGPTPVAPPSETLEYASAAVSSGRHQPTQKQLLAIRVIEWILSCGVAMVAGYAIISGSTRVGEISYRLTAELIVVSVVSPLLTLPLLAAGTDMAQRNRSGEALSSCVGIALLNLFVLLPSLVLVHWLLMLAKKLAWPWTDFRRPDTDDWYPILDQFVRQLPSLPIPTLAWRIDTVLLAVLGFAMFPVAIGRVRVGRLESLGLILVYAIYLVRVASLITRPGGV